MSLKQIKWHAAVLAVTVIAALTVLFALTTVTSNADTSYDPETRTYTMTGGTYREEIFLDPGTTTTIDLSGENILTHSTRCFSGTGDLIITGDGTLYIPESYAECNDLTIESGVKLKLGFYNINVRGNITVNGATIESENGQLSCGGYSSNPKHVINNAQLKFARTDWGYSNCGLALFGEAVLNNCNVTLVDTTLSSSGGQITIDGGTYNCTGDSRGAGSSIMPLSVQLRAVVKNAVIKTDTACNIGNLEMTDSTFEAAIPETSGSHYGNSPAIWGDNLIFSGSKLKISGNMYEGLYASNLLVMTANTEMDIDGLMYGIVGKDVRITHSGGKIRALDPTAVAAVGAINGETYWDPSTYAGTITLNSVEVKEPAGATIGKILDTTAPSDEYLFTAITDGKNGAKSVTLEANHNWDAGKVTKQPTETAEGVKTYTCSICGGTKTEAIPKLAPQEPKTPDKGEDGTPFGKGASVQAAEAAILALPNDNDPAGTAFGLLQLKATKVTKNSINLKWKAVPGAAKYILFANKCGTGNKYKKLGEVTGTSYTATQAAGAAIQKGTYYKFMMIAADSSGKVVSTSKTVHAATKGGKIGNHKKVTVKKSVTKKAKKLKKGKTLKLKAKAVPQAKKLKVRKHRGIMYESSNPAVAQVNGKGAVKGVGKGTCYIYAYAQNGTCAKVKVTVK